MRLINLDDLNELIDYYISQAEENLETAHGCDDSDNVWVWQGVLNTWRGFKEEAQGLSVADVAEASTRRDYKLDEWCNDCKEYDHEKHCCPRFNRVIRETVNDFKKEHYKTGKWVLDEERSKECVEHIYICSACHNNEAWGETERTRYCSYCGAEMENWT